MNEVWFSKEWDNAPMPHAIFFMKDGHAIHGSYEVKSLGKPVSHGCVRISPKNATTLYGLVGKDGLKNTQVVLTGITPGGESKVASQTGPGRTPGLKPESGKRGCFAIPLYSGDSGLVRSRRPAPNEAWLFGALVWRSPRSVRTVSAFDAVDGSSTGT